MQKTQLLKKPMEGGGGDESPSRSPAGEVPAGLSSEEYEDLRPRIEAHHRYRVGPGQCSSLLAQRIKAPAATVWSVVRRFDRPQVYKHFIRSCAVKGGGEIRPGCLREVSVISGLPASTSTERLEVLDESLRVTGFTNVGGDHRLRNYRSNTTVDEVRGRGAGEGEIWAVVVESYVVDVPEGNTEDDTQLFADTVVRLNLQKLASVAEAMAAAEKRG
ncbi:abscisic acid receptor PYR1-like [Canna indica]|uniref:Abscisic acid receptor PYR1-like n=1 Tax=Canna indica TaxID=4628 RepID=A0AAQ3QCX6_9LILI|nr:abscisic acid receptor PYR1-like [Canna indica]